MLTLQARHYSYECKSTVQERPYNARPSRTQQLANPRLVPKLTSDQPNDLMKKCVNPPYLSSVADSFRAGVADQQLARIEAERGRKSNSENGRARSRSQSSSSISTVSTNLSRGNSPKRMRMSSPKRDNKSRKRRRRSSSSSGSLSSEVIESRELSRAREDRNTRRRRSSTSPRRRGRDDYFNSQQERSRTDSMDRGHIARHRNSLDDEDRPLQEASNRPHDGRAFRDKRREYAKAPPRQRSPSPYSKRLALTQAMNMAR